MSNPPLAPPRGGGAVSGGGKVHPDPPVGTTEPSPGLTKGPWRGASPSQALSPTNRTSPSRPWPEPNGANAQAPSCPPPSETQPCRGGGGGRFRGGTRLVVLHSAVPRLLEFGLPPIARLLGRLHEGTEGSRSHSPPLFRCTCMRACRSFSLSFSPFFFATTQPMTGRMLLSQHQTPFQIPALQGCELRGQLPQSA